MDQINNQAESVSETDPDGIIRWHNTQRLLHRRDGPAIISPDGFEAWYLYGSPHRLDGPAIKYSDGRTQWWICGIHCKTQEEVEKIKQDFGIS